MKRKIQIALYGMLTLLLLVACSKDGESESIETSGPEEIELPEEEVVTYTAPFTGVESEEEQTMRPVLATINNHPLARPQSGISDADIVYELLAEGNMTRLLALFQTELPEEIGPIRSARDYFLTIAKGLDAFYVAHGYSPDALSLLQAGYVDHVNGMQHDGTLFQRSAERRAPHNSYISNENILLAEENEHVAMEIEKTPSLSFHESLEDAKLETSVDSFVVQNGTHADFISTYAYDEGTGTYTRTVNGTLTVDKANDQQVELTNVLVFETAHQTIDAEGRQAIDLESGGQALLFQAGGVQEIEWKNMDGILVPVENGVPVKLVPGKTWIHIVPTSRGLESVVSYTPLGN